MDCGRDRLGNEEFAYVYRILEFDRKWFVVNGLRLSEKF